VYLLQIIVIEDDPLLKVILLKFFNTIRNNCMLCNWKAEHRDIICQPWRSDLTDIIDEQNYPFDHVRIFRDTR